MDVSFVRLNISAVKLTLTMAVWVQKYPNEGLVNVVNNVFDFDTYNKELRETVTETLHKHGIPIGADPRNLQLAKE